MIRGVKTQKPPVEEMRVLLTRTIDDLDGIVLDIAPTMKFVVHQGRRFDRWNNNYTLRDDGIVCQRYGLADTEEFMRRSSELGLANV